MDRIKDLYLHPERRPGYRALMKRWAWRHLQRMWRQRDWPYTRVKHGR